MDCCPDSVPKALAITSSRLRKPILRSELIRISVSGMSI